MLGVARGALFDGGVPRRDPSALHCGNFQGPECEILAFGRGNLSDFRQFGWNSRKSMGFRRIVIDKIHQIRRRFACVLQKSSLT